MIKKNNFPKKIAIFPLSNAIFFPRTILPLNIFEDRYIQLINDCMSENRMFGMVQPKNKSKTLPEVYKIGCLGKITSFNETKDNRFIISLLGIIRFRIKNEIKNGTRINQIMRHTLGLYHGITGSSFWKKYLSQNLCVRDADVKKIDHIMDKVKLPSQLHSAGQID